jgi:hypothetical protein
MDNKNRLVSVAMPSEKDLEVMEETIMTLKSFGISYEVTVISAHRSPEQMFEYIKNANDSNQTSYIRSFEPGEDWEWCYVDEMMVQWYYRYFNLHLKIPLF